MPGKVNVPCDAAWEGPNSTSPTVPVVKRKAPEETTLEINTTTNSPSEPTTEKSEVQLSTGVTVEVVEATPKDAPARKKAKLSTEAIIEEDVSQNGNGNQETNSTQLEPKPATANAPKRARAPSAPKGASKKNPNIREKKLKCTHEGCDKVFARPCRLEEHLRSHTNERPFKCTADPEHCDKDFLRESHLKAHIKAIHEKAKTFRCTFQIPNNGEDNRGIFGFKRKASEPLEGGDAEREGEDGHRECGAGFTTNQHLKRHLDSHLKTFPHICKDYPPCAAGFRKKGPLTRHIRAEHLNLPPWACSHPDVENPSDKCIAAFDTKGKLGNHISLTHTGLAKKRYICAVCSTSSDIPPSPSPAPPLDPHPNKHSDSPDFPIITTPINPILRSSGKSGFTTHAELRLHISTFHPPRCPHCAFTAKRSRELRTHITQTHSSVDERRVYMCAHENCVADFTLPRNLRAHIKSIHQGVKPYLCPSEGCEERFTYKSVLENHLIKAHTPGDETNTPGRGKETRRKKKNVKNRRARRTKEMGLLGMLTGVGYEETGRNWECPVEGCRWRCFRKWDLAKHLSAIKAHNLGEDEVARLMGIVNAQEGSQSRTVAGGEDIDAQDMSEGETSSDSEWSVGSEDEDTELEEMNELEKKPREKGLVMGGLPVLG